MNESIQTITTAQAASAGGHYVQATVYQNQVYVSGQLPVKANRDHTINEAFVIQARQAITNLLHILTAAGSNASRLLKVTVYLVGIEHWPAFNGIYAAMLGDHRPARSIVSVSALHYGYLVEIDAIATTKPVP